MLHVPTPSSLTRPPFRSLSAIPLGILVPGSRERLFTLLEALRRAGCRIAFDSNYRPRLWASRSEAQAAVTRALGLASLALPTFDDEAALFGDADPAATVRRLHGLGVEEVAVKCGPEPSLVRSEEHTSELQSLMRI